MATKNDALIHRMLRSPGGSVGRDLQRRTLRVQNAAKINAPVKDGRLRASITRSPVYETAAGPMQAVGSNVVYALAVHEGSGSPFAPPSWRIAHGRGRPVPARRYLVNALGAARS